MIRGNDGNGKWKQKWKTENGNGNRNTENAVHAHKCTQLAQFPDQTVALWLPFQWLICFTHSFAQCLATKTVLSHPEDEDLLPFSKQ